jgi:hypothetical protein
MRHCMLVAAMSLLSIPGIAQTARVSIDLGMVSVW